MAYRSPVQRQEKFEDVLVIDEERGLAILDDVSVKTKNPSTGVVNDQIKHLSVLEENGNFVYEIKFFVHTEKCAKLGITKAAINVYGVSPSNPLTKFGKNVSNTQIQNNDILSSKKRSKINLDAKSLQIEMQPNLGAMQGLGGASQKSSNKSLVSSTASDSCSPCSDKTSEPTFIATKNIVNEASISDTNALIASEIIDLCILPDKKKTIFDDQGLFSNVKDPLEMANSAVVNTSQIFKGSSTTAAISSRQGIDNKNKKGATVQNYKIFVEPPKTNVDAVKINQAKFTVKGTTSTGYINQVIKNLVDFDKNQCCPKNDKDTNESDVESINTNLLLTHGVHPAEVLETFFPKNPKQDSHSNNLPMHGVKSEQKNVREPVRQAPMTNLTIGANDKNPSIAASVFARTSPDSQKKDYSKSKGELGKNTADLCGILTKDNQLSVAVEPLVAEFQTKFREIFKKFNVNIKKTVSRQKLYFEIVLLKENPDELPLKKTFTVNHENQLREFTIPDIKPSLTLAGQKRGFNTLLVTQHDPFATSILIEKRLIRPNENAFDAYQTFQQINLSYRDKPVMLEIADLNTHPTSCVYRAISIGPYGQRGHNVANLVVRGIPVPVTSRVGISSSVTRASAALHAKNTTDGVRLTLSTYPANALSFYINKTEIGTQFAIDGKTAPIELTQGGGQVLKIRGNKGAISILDRKVYDGRSYRYTCVFKMPHAMKADNNSSEIIKFLRPLRQLPVNVELTELKIDENYLPKNASEAGNAQDRGKISFKIETTPTETGIEEITQLLVDNNVNDIFIEDLKKDRNRLSSVAFYEVERINLKTGKRENFGLSMTGIFEDNPEKRKQLKIKPILRGDRFEYLVHLYLKSPESLFKGATTQLTDDTSTALKNDQYALKTLSQKFALMYTKSSSLPSETELLDKSPASLRKQIMRGVTGFSKSLEARLQPINVSIGSISSARSPLGHNEISWKIVGDQKIVDHCVIYATANGKKQPIGVTAPGVDGDNIFFDKKFCSVIGTVAYSVELITLSLARVTSNLSTSITRSQTLPPALIDELTNDTAGIPIQNASAAEFQVGVDIKQYTEPRASNSGTNMKIFTPPRLK
jgi:hypothetical protein